MTVDLDRGRFVYAVTLVVYGNPGPQGSKDYVGHHGGKPILIESSKNKVDTWRGQVTGAARRHLADRMVRRLFPITAPTAARMIFTLPAPRRIPADRRGLPCVPPDLSKLCRATEDALTGLLYRDDALIVEYDRLAKVYPGGDREALDRPGAIISLRPYEGEPHAL